MKRMCARTLDPFVQDQNLSAMRMSGSYRFFLLGADSVSGYPRHAQNAQKLNLKKARCYNNY